MSQHNFSRWKEAPSSKPIYRDMFKSMHLSVLQNALRSMPNEEHFFIEYQSQDFILCESKGKLPDVTSLPLPASETDSLWLCLQFQGKTVFPEGTVIEPNTLCSFKSSNQDTQLTLSAEKSWVLLLGVSASSMQQLLSEWPSLRDHFDEIQQDILPVTPISYTERQAMESFSKLAFGPFSTIHHIAHLYIKLYSSYVPRAKNHLQNANEEPNIQLYHRAVAHIRENYLEKVLNRETIAEALHCSVRTLNRAFEGRALTLNATILAIRIYKAREILIREPHLSIEEIAWMLHFFDASHFISQYKKHFHLTPRQERRKLELHKK